MSNLTPELMNELSRPFDPALVQWKPQATNRDKTKALAVAYVDTRAYIDRLNEVCGADWSDDYQLMDGGSLVLCRLTIGGVTRCDVGEKDANDQNTATSAIAQAFKRAATKFGLGRYLYALPKTWAGYDGQRKRFTAGALDKLERIAGVPAGGNGNGARPARQPAPSAQPPAPKANGNGAFASKGDAITWAMTTGVFNHGQHAANAYEKLKRERQPQTAAEMAQLWRDDVAHRLAAKERDEALPVEPATRGKDKLFKS